MRTASLTVNYADRRYIITDARMNAELLAIRNIHYLTLPTWIRLPSHSHHLKSPASLYEYDFT